MITFLAAVGSTPVVLNNGPCLDSIVSVPERLNGPDTSADVVRIDKVISTSTMLDGEVIGYLYTRQDGTTWLGQRRQEYMSAADSEAINHVLAYSRMPDSNVTAFPPVRLYGLKTNYQQTIRIVPPQPSALQAMTVRLEPCVAWPAGTALPTP